MDRRRDGQGQRSPLELLHELPALVVLERIPVPVLAIASDGAIVFVNGAFAEMVGYPVGEVTAMKFGQLFYSLPADDSVLSVVRAHAGLVVELLHQDGSVVRARMSKSALLRGDDPVALATFQDLTERLWVQEL